MATAADVLNTSDRQRVGGDGTTLTLTLRVRRFNPEVSADSWWDEWTVDCHPLDRLVEVMHQVKPE